MPQKNHEKSNHFQELKTSIVPILVAPSNKTRPFIELFEGRPENITLQPLGQLMGFFKINDTSENSAYIVNFLTSVAKKEYYINPRRSVSESFDSALHKVNVALAEVAKNGIVEWLGNIDGAVCVFEKDALHFSVTGNGRVLLLRNQVLSDISEGLAADGLEPNPLKTFVNVSSGRLEKGDKLIITSDDLFTIFSVAEIKKGASRFDREKFVQFFKTAMINELDFAATIVADVFDAPPAEKTEIISSELEEGDEFNPFSEKSFHSPSANKNSLGDKLPLEKTEYTDEKTGHIYIQGDGTNVEKQTKSRLYLFLLREKLSDFNFWLRNQSKKLFSFLWNSLKKIFTRAPKKTEVPVKETTLPTPSPAQATVSTDNKSFSSLLPFLTEKIIFILKGLGRILKATFDLFHLKIFVPSFSRIKNTFSRLSYQQKLYALLVILAIIVIPLLIVSSSKKVPEVIVEEPSPEQQALALLMQDVALRPVELESLTTSPQLKAVLFLENKLLTVSEEKIVLWEENSSPQEYSLPPEAKNIISVASMPDLNLVFILNQAGKIFSFSPVSKQFKENSIVWPENKIPRLIGTYLTYLYALNDNQLYRFPRAEGGFGPGLTWLKDTIDLSGINSITIDENIYLSSGSVVTKLFRGKKEDFSLQSANVPVVFRQTLTLGESDDFYGLDDNQGRLIRFKKDGTIVAQYYNEKIKGATNFTVAKEKNKAFIVANDQLYSFGL